jgi:hypothetical protein
MSKEVRISHSETLAKQILDQYFGEFKKLDNVRPDWLSGLEIDRFYPTLGIAIEFQGDQHYRTVPGMHKGPADFQRQLQLDTQKRDLIEKQGMKLYPIDLLDLDRFRVKNLFKRMAVDGERFAWSKGNKQELAKLQKIRWDWEPDKNLMRQSDRFSKMKKNYYRPKKKSWWNKLLGG